MSATATKTYSIAWHAGTEDGHNWTMGAPDRGTLDEIRGWCKDAGVNATLYFAGVSCGRVMTDGSYRIF